MCIESNGEREREILASHTNNENNTNDCEWIVANWSVRNEFKIDYTSECLRADIILDMSLSWCCPCHGPGHIHICTRKHLHKKTYRNRVKGDRQKKPKIRDREREIGGEGASSLTRSLVHIALFFSIPHLYRTNGDESKGKQDAVHWLCYICYMRRV